MQFITITGKLGKDAESRQAGGSDVVSFSVAVDQGFGQKKTTNWFRVSVWGKRGAAIQQYLTKGTAVTVTGELTIGDYNGKPQFDVSAADVALQGGGQQSGGGGGGTSQRARPAPTPMQSEDLDDDVPFITKGEFMSF